MKAILLLALGMVLLCVNPVFCGTRTMVAFGTDVGSFSAAARTPFAIHLSGTMDAPPAIRKHVPLEINVGLTGPYDHGDGVYSYAPYRGPYDYHHWDPRFSVSEAVRIYAIGRANAEHIPDGMEAGLGIGNHQFVSDRRNGHAAQTEGTRVESQWRASGFFRANFQPRSRAGMFMELEYQRGIFANDNYYLPVNSLMLQLGYRFRV